MNGEILRLVSVTRGFFIDFFYLAIKFQGNHPIISIENPYYKDVVCPDGLENGRKSIGRKEERNENRRSK